MGWYHLVGTSHIAAKAVRDVKDAFGSYVPDVVAVELDENRLEALLSKNKRRASFLQMTRVVGVKGALFGIIGGAAQRKLGRMVGTDPGADMLAAVKLARKTHTPTLLIDRDIRITLLRLNKALGWRELKQAIKDTWNGLRGKERMTFDLKDVPSEETVDKLLEVFAERYPRPFKVLVEERNHVMVRALAKYHDEHPSERILVVVGAGHVKGMRELLERI